MTTDAPSLSHCLGGGLGSGGGGGWGGEGGDGDGTSAGESGGGRGGVGGGEGVGGVEGGGGGDGVNPLHITKGMVSCTVQLIGGADDANVPMASPRFALPLCPPR